VKNLFFIGMMGSGKTVTGRLAADKLSVRFVDLDDEIVARAQLSISDIFKKHGELFFRDLESSILKEFADKGSQMIATGGGIVLSQPNRDLMRKRGRIYYLNAALETLWDRVCESKDRPLINCDNPEEEFKKLFKVREPIYKELADKTVYTDHKTPELVAQEICESFLNS
jgi:shikimate kinase